MSTAELFYWVIVAAGFVLVVSTSWRRSTIHTNVETARHPLPVVQRTPDTQPSAARTADQPVSVDAGVLAAWEGAAPILNFFWHFPFLGFLIAAYAWAFGLVGYLFVIFKEQAHGMMQLAKFYLAPFSQGLVKRWDLNPQEPKLRFGLRASFWVAIGLVFSIALAVPIVVMGMTLVFLPAVVTIGRSITHVLNPAGTVCVPIAVALEVLKRKAGRDIAQYGGP